MVSIHSTSFEILIIIFSSPCHNRSTFLNSTTLGWHIGYDNCLLVETPEFDPGRGWYLDKVFLISTGCSKEKITF